jgi:hypothetical protein
VPSLLHTFCNSLQHTFSLLILPCLHQASNGRCSPFLRVPELSLCLSQNNSQQTPTQLLLCQQVSLSTKCLYTINKGSLHKRLAWTARKQCSLFFYCCVTAYKRPLFTELLPSSGCCIIACLVVLVVTIFQCDLPYNSPFVSIIIRSASVIKWQSKTTHLGNMCNTLCYNNFHSLLTGTCNNCSMFALLSSRLQKHPLLKYFESHKT